MFDSKATLFIAEKISFSSQEARSRDSTPTVVKGLTRNLSGALRWTLLPTYPEALSRSMIFWSLLLNAATTSQSFMEPNSGITVTVHFIQFTVWQRATMPARARRVNLVHCHRNWPNSSPGPWRPLHSRRDRDDRS